MQNSFGFVTFAGAGAGGLENLTIGVLRAIENSQAILYDALIDPEIIELFPIKCIKICVGKRAGFHSVPQNKTNDLMVKLALRGLNIVRLKGGDPSIFGRISEERDALNINKISHKTLAGISAVQVAAAQFDIPLTKRGLSRSIELVTVSDLNNEFKIDENILQQGKTIAIYMGSKKAENILKACINAKIPLNTPVAIIESAGMIDANLILGSVEEIVGLCHSCNNGPVLILIGCIIDTKRSQEIDISQNKLYL